ncbi:MULTISPECIES: hypothetical protein [unclassified Pseudodesulfovibrio]|uniref:hypothetical protein n=1 Tax=unclassified Pseudodesulfovibrio TaxID=2661612 RepID=UPI000FEC2010|nr:MULTISPECIES: hypothetical protein [unclassified Pseudodesulfovibrio]MCJ2165486.1 hypothetical protein [Pseudodesulfovibrio sp. S3-i]RWU03235.1 hypothetical protein DWB63_12655 [Pseudodesulfovibrio sp. S3]
MSNHTMEEIEELFGRLLDVDLPVPPSADVNAALRLVDCMESKGFSFKLTDLAPKSLYDCRWRATLTHGKREFSAEDTQPAVAICIAAAAALTGQSDT